MANVDATCTVTAGDFVHLRIQIRVNVLNAPSFVAFPVSNFPVEFQSVLERKRRVAIGMGGQEFPQRAKTWPQGTGTDTWLKRLNALKEEFLYFGSEMGAVRFRRLTFPKLYRLKKPKTTLECFETNRNNRKNVCPEQCFQDYLMGMNDAWRFSS